MSETAIPVNARAVMPAGILSVPEAGDAAEAIWAEKPVECICSICAFNFYD